MNNDSATNQTEFCTKEDLSNQRSKKEFYQNKLEICRCRRQIRNLEREEKWAPRIDRISVIFFVLTFVAALVVELTGMEARANVAYILGFIDILILKRLLSRYDNFGFSILSDFIKLPVKS